MAATEVLISGNQSTPAEIITRASVYLASDTSWVYFVLTVAGMLSQGAWLDNAGRGGGLTFHFYLISSN